MRLTKKLLSAFLALVMVFTMLPVQAFASETVSDGTKLPVQGARPQEAPSAGEKKVLEQTITIKVGEKRKVETNHGKYPFNDWQSENSSIATSQQAALEYDATITGVEVGTTHVMEFVITGYGRSEIVQIVTVHVITNANGIAIPAELLLNGAETKKLEATVTPGDARGAEIIWASDNESVAKVDQEGNVTSVSAGTANITAKIKDTEYSGCCAVTVNDVSAESIHLEDLQLLIGKEGKMALTAVPAMPLNPQIDWTITDSSIATIAQDGTVTALKEGTAQITATLTSGEQTLTATATLTVMNKANPESIQLNKKELTLRPVQKETLIASLTPDGDINRELKWESSNPESVTVDENGQVTAVAPGGATITVTTVNGLKASCDVTVQNYSPQEDGTTTVYVYLKIDDQSGQNKTDGWKTNKDGWYTIGELTVPNTVLGAPGSSPNPGPNALKPYLPYIKIGTYNSDVATTVPWDDCTWVLHVVANGATDYVGDGNTWHLDGKYVIPKEPETVMCSYTVNFVDEYGNAIPGQNSITGTVEQHTLVKFWIPEIEGYTFDNIKGLKPSTEEEYQFVVMEQNTTVNVVYKANEQSYTVRYVDEGTGKQISNPVTHRAQYAEKIKVSSISPLEIDNYKFKGYDPAEELTVGKNNGVNLITLYYTRNQHTVTYKYTDPTTQDVITTEQHGAGLEVTAKTPPNIPGYTFSGWEDTAEENKVKIENGKFTMPNRDVTFTGSYSVPESQKYAVKATIKLGDRELASETKTEISWGELGQHYGMAPYELANEFWSLGLTSSDNVTATWNPSEADAARQYDADNDGQYHEVTITLPENSPALVTLTYDANGGAGGPGSVTVLKGTDVTISNAQPTRDNYTFKGWNAAANGSDTSYPANSKITLTDNTTLYAQWEANTAGYTVQHWFQKADGSGYEQREDVPDDQGTGTIGQTITPNKLSDDKIPVGFAFGKMDENVTIAANGNAVAKVYYDRKSYNISYELEGDVKPEGANVPNSSTGRYGAQITIAGDLSIDGYTFTGWYTKEDAPVQVTEKMSTFTMPAGDVTLYGTFSKRTDLSYTVKYIWNGEILGTATGKGTLGDPIDPEVKDFEGYTFKDKQTGVTITADAAKNVVNVYYYKNVTLTANSNEEPIVYDGQNHIIKGYTVTVDRDKTTVDGLIFEGVEEPTVTATNAGEYPLTFVENPVGQKDSTGKYIVTEVENGTLTINKLPVTVTAKDISVSYGEPVGNLTATKSAAGGVEIPANFDSVVTYTLAHDGGETPNVGQYPIYFEIDGEKIENKTTIDKYTNYKVTFVPGTLTVTAAEGLTFKAKGYNGVYDGRDHSATATSDIPGTIFRYKVGDGGWQNEAPSIRDVGSKFVMVKAINSNYNEAETQTVELKVTPRPVTLTSQGDSKMYDGTPLSKEEVVPTTTLEDKQPWVDGEGVEFYNFAQQTDVTDEQGVDNTFDYQSKPGTNLDNYAIKKVYGKLVVTPSNALTVVATGEDWTYDGIERSPSVQVKIGDQEIQDAEVLYSKDGIAWSKTPIKAKNVSDSGTFRVKAQYTNYQAAEATYTMTVSKRAVTIQSADGEQVYNGTPLKVETVNVVAGSFVEGEGLNYTGFTAQTDVTNPSVENKYSYSYAEGTLEGNYNIKREFGQLTVKPAKATVSVNSIKNHVYDGLVPDVTATVEGVLEQDREKIQYELTWKKLADVGIYDVTFQDPNTTQGNYEVTFVGGTVTIDPKPVTVTAVSPASVVYGNELPELTIDEAALQEQLVNSDDISAITYTLAFNETNFRDGKALVGEHEIVFVNQKEDQGNYKVSFVPAKLIVTAPENLDDYVVKTHEGQNFKVGDAVTFKITVTNIYAVDATVTLEEMAGMTFGDGKTTLEDVLDPGQTKTYSATRTLTDADFEKGGVNNTVTVTLTPEGENPTTGTDTDEVVLEEKPNMSVVKSVVDPKESYRVGDTIQYQITVTNTGNVTLYDLRLTDEMNADGKVTFPAGTDLTRDKLAVDATWTVRCSYVVREADEGKVIFNKATVIAHDPETKNPEKEAGDTTDGEQVQNLYSLTIHYRNGAGTAVAPSFRGRYHAGDQWKVVSPIVAGYYEPHIRSISSDEAGMPAKDLVYVVTYAAIPAPVDPDPERPNPNPSEPDEEDEETVPTTMPETELPPEPADFTVDPDDYTLTEVEDNETPLANMDLDGHTCCIMHLLLMLAAMVVLGFYTKSRKKHQARIFELKRILAAEEDHPDDPQQP